MALRLDGAGSARRGIGRPYGAFGGLWRRPSGAAAGYPNGKSYDPRIPPPEIYGLSSGVVGLRLFPNPNFDTKALERWLKVKDKYASIRSAIPSLVRPYPRRHELRVLPCLVPPAESAARPRRTRRGRTSPATSAPSICGSAAVFGNLLPKNNFVYHILDSQPPGTIDTSLIASDNINNPNTMNSVFNLAQRVAGVVAQPEGTAVRAERRLPSVWRKLRTRPRRPPHRRIR